MSFGGQGFRTLDGPWGQFDAAAGVAVLPDGRIVMVGTAFSGGTSSSATLAVWILTSSGALDYAPGHTGYVTYDAASYVFGRDVIIDSNGHIVVGGSSDLGVDDPTIWRLTSNGRWDATFSGDGMMRFVLPGENRGGGIQEAADGGYYIVGEENSGRMSLRKCLENGGVDNAFGSGGSVYYDPDASSEGAYGVAVDGLGQIYVAGWVTGPGGQPTAALWRYTSGGLLDATFNADGAVPGLVSYSLDPASANEFYEVLVDGSDRPLAVGKAFNGTDSALLLVRLTPSGLFDSSFGSAGDGRVIVDDILGGTGDDIGYDLTFDGAGRILVVGQSDAPNQSSDMLVMRFTPVGAIDTSFGASGTGTISHHGAGGGNGSDAGHSVAIDPVTGRVVVVGSSDNGVSTDAAIWRVCP